MERMPKRFNWKARQNTGQNKIPSVGIEIEDDSYNQKQRFDECNAFILPAKKTKKTEIKKEILIKKPLSKKEKKRLQKIREKKKKINRAELNQKLKKVQLATEESDLLTSTSIMQTSGLKRFSTENSAKPIKINTIKGSKRKLTPPPKKKIRLPPNILGFDEDYSSDSDSEIEESPSISEKNKVSNSKLEMVEDLIKDNEKEKNEKQENADLSKTNIEDTIQQPANFVSVSQLPEIQRPKLIKKLKQMKSEENDLLASALPIQTLGSEKVSAKNSAKQTKIRNIKGSKKKIKPPSKKKIKLDPNIVASKEDISSKSDSEMKECPNISEINNVSNSKLELIENLIKDNEKAKNEKQEVLPNKEENAELSKTNIEDTIEQPANYVYVPRLPEIQAAREALPIFSEEYAIIEAINEHPVVIIHGETGTGKTTQVPQFLYEAKYAMNGKMIGITEPRRIAAISMAKRVAKEMNLPNVVSYQIRYKSTTNKDTKIKFMTDGILLQEIKQDYLLSKYSIIIIDEAHERSIFSDVLLGLLSDIIVKRSQKGDKLKLVIMSATIRVEDFMENKKLFPQTPYLLKLPSCQHRVVVHFQQTPFNYVEAAYDKVCKIHLNLAYGGILVFLTGQNEILQLCKMLQEAFPFRDNKSSSKIDSDEEIFNQFKSRKKYRKNSKKGFDLVTRFDLDDYSTEPLDSDENIGHDFNVIKSNNAPPLYVLPLYSTLSAKEQAKIFKPPPLDSRLCVVSTNVAETSITIPGLKYVVDSGKVKTKVYNKCGGISRHIVTWISKASANQRAGRAGRTQGGHCFRLYPSEVFNCEFPDYSPPEIQVMPIDDILLQMKAIGISTVVDFPFPSPPDRERLKAAEIRLIHLGALDDSEKKTSKIDKEKFSAKITPFGKEMSRFSVSPCFSRMLLLSHKNNCIPYGIALVSALTVSHIFKSDVNESDKEQKGNKLWKGIKNLDGKKETSLLLGDAMVILKCIGAYEEAKDKIKFCNHYQIIHKSMIEIQQMRKQLIREMNRSIEGLSLPMDLKLDPPSPNEIINLRKIMICGFPENIARRIPEGSTEDITLKNAYQCLALKEPVFIHRSSILYTEKPEFVVYHEMISTSKYYMLNVVAIEADWLPPLAPRICKRFSDPFQNPPPVYNKNSDEILCNMTAIFGPKNWELPCIRMPMLKGHERYKWFCYFLLEGEICPFFKTYKKYLSPQPSYMITSVFWKLTSFDYVRNKSYFDIFISVKKADIDTREALYKKWSEEPHFLLQEYLEWFKNSNGIDKKSMALEIQSQWPPKH